MNVALSVQSCLQKQLIWMLQFQWFSNSENVFGYRAKPIGWYSLGCTHTAFAYVAVYFLNTKHSPRGDWLFRCILEILNNNNNIGTFLVPASYRCVFSCNLLLVILIFISVLSRWIIVFMVVQEFDHWFPSIDNGTCLRFCLANPINKL